MSEDITGEKAPSGLRTVTENAVVMGLMMGVALAAGEHWGTAGEVFAGALLVTSGVILKAKNDLDTHRRSVGPAESNREFLNKIALAIKGLRRQTTSDGQDQDTTGAVVLSGD